MLTVKDSAMRHFDAGAAAYIRGDYRESVRRFTAAIKSDAGCVAALAYRGAAYVKLNHLKSALDDLNRAIRLEPEFALAYHFRGLAHEAKGQFARAYRDHDRALEIDPECRMAYEGRQSALARQPSAEPTELVDIIHHLDGLRLNRQAAC